MKTITNLKNTIMKKLLLLFVLFTGISATRAQYVVIPDPAFVTWLQNNGYSACLQGNQLDTTCSLVLNTTTLTIGNQKIYNLSGIQYFKNLTILDAQHDSIGIIPALPPVLENLDVEWNNLSSLPPLPPTLISLICGTNPFVTLPVLPASLKRLWCRGSFLSTMPALPDSIGDVDVANGQLNEIPYLPPALVYFDCSYNQITSIADFPDSIYSFTCANNPNLKCLPQLKKVAFLDFSSTGITCLSNYPTNANVSSTPSLAGYPLCTAGNPNGCLVFTPGTVWPGDADHDGLANNADLLPIGIAYGNTGPVRAGASIVWQGQAATDWTDTIANGANQKHVDCNGDGVINANDTTAILLNFGLTHAKTDDVPEPWRAGAPELSLQFSKDTLVEGDTLIVSLILGDAATPVSNIYGLAFSYNYDPKVVDSNTVVFRYTNSWFGTNSNKISIHKDFKKAGVIRTAVTGIDHVNRSGNGKIAEFIATITTGNINGKNLSYYRNVSFISGITAVDKNGKSLPVNGGMDSSEVAFTPTGVNNITAFAEVKVYPNPASSFVQIQASKEAIGLPYALTDLTGRELLNGKITNEISHISIADVARGIYMLHVGDAVKYTVKLVKE